MKCGVWTPWTYFSMQIKTNSIPKLYYATNDKSNFITLVVY